MLVRIASRHLRVACREEYPQARSQLMRGMRKVGSVHLAGHDDVREQQIDGGPER
jgi:hypothetical protein